MHVIYSGATANMLEGEQRKLEAKLAKVAKVAGRNAEKDVHVIFSNVRHLFKAEVTMNAHGHALVAESSHADAALAMSESIEKLEKQMLKLRTKRRDTHRHPHKEAPEPAEPAAAPAKQAKPIRTAKAAAPKKAAVKEAKPAAPKIFRVDNNGAGKPMALDEAILEMETGMDYFVYRDSKTNRVCTLLRRADGHLDLIES